MICLAFLFSLILTVILEGAVSLLIFRSRSFVYYSFLCNLLTNPALNLILLVSFKFLGAGYYTLTLAAAEIAVIFTEAYLYKKLGGISAVRAVLFSLGVNGFSFGAGLLIGGLFGL